MVGAAPVACLMVGYDVDFGTILRHELHEKAFGELTNLSLPNIIQRLCNKMGVIEILGVDERVPAMTTSQMRTMKGLACLGTSSRLR